MNLDSFVEEILDVAREQSHDDAKMIIVDRIEKDILRPRRSLISAVELQDIKQELDRWHRRRRGDEEGNPISCLEFIAAYVPELLQTAKGTLAPSHSQKTDITQNKAVNGNPRPITDADLIESANRNYDLGRKHGKEEIAEELNAPKCSVCLKPTGSYCVSCGAVVCFRCNCPNWPMGVKTHPITQLEDDCKTTT